MSKLPGHNVSKRTVDPVIEKLWKPSPQFGVEGSDLYKTLLLGTIAEQKAFIRSFIKKIFIDYPTAILEYTIPISLFEKSNKEVLVFVPYGSA